MAEGEGGSLFVWPPRLGSGGDVDGERAEDGAVGGRRATAGSEGTGGPGTGESRAVRAARAVSPARIGRDDRMVELGGPTRIIVPLTGTDVDELRAQCLALRGHPVDVVEWRVDLLAAVQGGPGAGAGGVVGGTLGRAVVEALEVVLGDARLPVLATVRTVHEGGAAGLGDLGYRELVGLLATSGADAVDVEYRRAGAGSIIERAHRAGVAVIASNHDFGGTPPEEEVIARLVAMRDLGADVAKVAYRAQDPLDMFPVLNAQMWARDHLGIPVIAISMGAAGAVTRIGGERLGSAATFATVGRGSAPGQFSAEEVAQVLRTMREP